MFYAQYAIGHGSIREWQEGEIPIARAEHNVEQPTEDWHFRRVAVMEHMESTRRWRCLEGSLAGGNRGRYPRKSGSGENGFCCGKLRHVQFRAGDDGQETPTGVGERCRLDPEVGGILAILLHGTPFRIVSQTFSSHVAWLLGDVGALGAFVF
jgi:hypothetical protein